MSIYLEELSLPLLFVISVPHISPESNKNARGRNRTILFGNRAFPVYNESMSLPATPVYVLHVDASCNPNPGPMGIGYVLKADNQLIAAAGAGIGQGTNNLAEYYALVLGLRHALRLGMYTLVVYSDSLLVVNQLTGLWKLKAKGRLKRLHTEALKLLNLFSFVTLVHIRREENAEADALSRQVKYVTPILPPLPLTGFGVMRKKLYEWQAAALREWYGGGERNTKLLARIFHVAPQTVEAVITNKSYKHATASETPVWPVAGQPLLALGEEKGIGGSFPGSVLSAE